MKNLILCNNLYNDIEGLTTLITNLEYVDVLQGKEIEDFQYAPDGIDKMFSEILQEPVELQGGQFRKPNTLIHFDNFYQHTLWTGIVALEETELRLYEHELGYKSFFGMPPETNMDQFFIDNCNDSTKWKARSIINMEKNDFVFVRPWLWKSLMEDKLVQVFTLNHKIEESKE